MTDVPARTELEYSLTTTSRGKIDVKMVDRITVDDVFLHLVRGEIYRVVTGVDNGSEVDDNFKDFLLKEQYVVGRI